MAPKQKFQLVKAPRIDADPAVGFLVDPPQTLDDVIEKVNESSPKYTIQAQSCSTESEFDTNTLKVYSFAFAIPHIVQTSEFVWADDARGALVELQRVGVSFKNVSNQDISLHANVPIAKQFKPQLIYTRLSGFHTKGKKGAMSDDIVLQPGQTATFKVNLKQLSNEYIPMEKHEEARLWINLCTFGIVIKDINQQTGTSYAPASSVVEAMPKATYTKRKSNPVLLPGVELDYQAQENFVLQKMDNGFSDLYNVDVVDVSSTGQIGDHFYRRPGRQLDIFPGGDVQATYIQDAIAEGPLLGIHKVLAKNIEGNNVTIAGLTISEYDGEETPLSLRFRRATGNRLLVPALTLSNLPTTSYGEMVESFSNFKWHEESSHWVLWDEKTEQPVVVNKTLTNLTPISAGIPMVLLRGVHTKLEKEQQIQMYIGLTNVHGQPYGRPQSFGTFIRKAFSVIEVVAQIASVIKTLL
jgi:hypothetical protein